MSPLLKLIRSSAIQHRQDVTCHRSREKKNYVKGKAVNFPRPSNIRCLLVETHWSVVEMPTTIIKDQKPFIFDKKLNSTW